MITGADEYPFHQTPEPIAFAGTDRNFYDRFFFNGYSADGELFFAVALGVYPQLGIIDGAVCALIDGQQHNVRLSRRMDGDRSKLVVGPLSIDILEPMQRVRIKLEPCDSPITLDATFQVRHDPVEEPRFTRRIGTRTFMDYTRLTQNVCWTGQLGVNGKQYALQPDRCFGTRDRSWGVRPVGAPDSQPPPQGNLPQFFWLWNPCNFDDHVAFSHTNDDAHGRPWNRRAGIQQLDGPLVEFEDVEYVYDWHPDSRRIRSLTALLRNHGHEASISFTPLHNFYMSGLGYMHPEWGHGMDHGEYAFAADTIDTATCSEHNPLHLHIQAISRAELRMDGTRREGIGVVEQLFIGPHAPAGFGEGLELL